MFSDELRYWREVQGISQAQLARLLSRSPITVNAWECGRLEIPDWLADWLEHLEFEVGAGNGIPVCPNNVDDIRCLLYRAPRLAREASEARREARRIAAGERTTLKIKRDVRRSLRLTRQANSELLAAARENPGRNHAKTIKTS